MTPKNFDSRTHLREIVISAAGKPIWYWETSYHLNAGDSLVVRANMPHRTIKIQVETTCNQFLRDDTHGVDDPAVLSAVLGEQI